MGLPCGEILSGQFMSGIGGGGTMVGSPCLSLDGCGSAPPAPAPPPAGPPADAYWSGGGGPVASIGGGMPMVSPPSAPIPCIGLNCGGMVTPISKPWTPGPADPVYPGAPGGAGTCGAGGGINHEWWAGPATPMATSNPVSFESGHKLISEVDISIPLRGRDFELTRSYTSNPAVLDGMVSGSIPRMLGVGWSMGVAQSIHVEATLSEPNLHLGAAGGAHVFEHDGGTPGTWRPAGPSAQWIRKDHLVVGETTYPTYVLVQPGEWETHFYRERNTEDDEEDEWTDPEALVGAVLRMTDIYGNFRQFVYENVDESPSVLTRLTEIRFFAKGADESEDDPDASVQFTWVTATTPSKGCLQKAEVVRYPEGSPTVVGKVVYVYFDTADDIGGVGTVSEDVGRDGDLVQVETWQPVDLAPSGAPEGNWHVTVKQYRYHRSPEDPEDPEYPTAGEYTFEGADHQIKAVFMPQQIEWAAQQANAGSGMASVLAYATGSSGSSIDGLLERDDDEALWSSASSVVLDLAAKVVEKYETSDPGRVLRQYLLSACGCAGTAQGLRLDYSRSTWTPEDPGDIAISVKVEERVWSGTAWNLARTRYHDLAHFSEEFAGEERDFHLLAHDVLEVVDGSAKRWATMYAYDLGSETDAGKRRIKAIYSPAAIASYTPGTTSAPVATPQSSSGGYTSFAYDTNHRLRLVTLNRILSGDDESSVLRRVTYRTDARTWLPAKVELPLDEGMAEADLDDSGNADKVQVIEYDYGFHAGTDAIFWTQAKVEAETQGENGPGGHHYSHSVHDEFGRNTWTRQADNTLIARTFDDPTGAVMSIVANSPDSGLPSGLPTLPTGNDWDGRAEAGLSLTHIHRHDLLGRLRSTTLPSGVVHRFTHELRLLPHQGAAQDGRPGILYFAHVMLPERISTTPTLAFAGPASVLWKDAAGAAICRSDFAMAATTSDYGSIFPEDPYAFAYAYTVNTSAIKARAAIVHDSAGQIEKEIVWHDFVNTGNDGGGWYRTSHVYDDEGRLQDTIQPNLSLTRLVYDQLGRVVEVKAGVDGAGSPSKVASYFYDGATTSTLVVGNGNLTRIVEETGESSPATRTTDVVYDWRDQPVKVSNPVPPHQFMVHDNQGRVVKAAAFSTLPSGSEPSNIGDNLSSRLAYAETAHGQRGLIFRSRIAVDPQASDLTTRGFLESHVWYDAAGRAVAEWGPNGPGVKHTYDALGRPTASYVLDRSSDSLPGTSTTFSGVFSASTRTANLDGDVVFEQVEYTYRDTLGFLDLVTHRSRLHDASESTATGPLTGSTSITTYQAIEYDAVGRPIRSKDFGTNLLAGFERDGGSAAPPEHNNDFPLTWDGNIDPLVTEQTYDDCGRVETVVQPVTSGSPGTTQTTKFLHDAMGRVYATIENEDATAPATLTWDGGEDRYVAGNIDSAAPDVNRVTTTRFHLVPETGEEADTSSWIEQVVHVAEGTTEEVQRTRYLFGVTQPGSPGASDSLVRSNDLLKSIAYPDASSGAPSTTDKVEFAYNRQGELRWQEDQRGVEHQYTYDAGGRLTLDLASGGTEVDYWADRIAIGYDSDGRLQTIETRDGTTVKNGIKLTYTELGQLEAFFQDPDGAVTETSGTPSGTTRKVVHAYDDVGITTSTAWSSTPGGNFSRLESITYPSGHVLEIGYNALSSGTSSDHFVSRVRTLDFDGTSRQVRYDFLGVATPVVVDYQGPDVQLDRTFSHDGSRQWSSYGNNPGKYPAFDAYGRLVRHAWLDGDLTKGTGSGAGYPTKPPLVEIEQAFNLASFITERFDDRPGSARNRDQQYTNDMLLRLLEATRGEMAGSTFTVKPGSEKYTYDFVGNFVEFDTDRTGDGDFVDAADQTIAGTFSMVNELEEIVVTEGGSSPTYEFEHDAAGNLSSRQLTTTRSLELVHDAWGRLTKVDYSVDSTSLPRARFEYNGLNMRTLVDRDADTSDGSHALTERRLMYYSSGWQVLEEHVDTDTPLNRDSASDIDRVVQTVWGPRYIDDLILRRQNNNHAGGGDTDFTDSGVDRPGDWALTDPQFSVIALIDDAATIVERVSYDAYGQARHHRAKDVDGDGDVDSTDGSIVHAARGKSIHQTGYNADADWDRDGDVDTADEAAFGSSHWQSAIALGQISAVDNAFGFCAYVFNPETGWYTVRFRHYDPTTGVARWLERDPAGYVDGPSLYGYGESRPADTVDPSGLWSWRHFWRSIGSSLGSIGGTYWDIVRGRWDNIKYRYDDGPMGQAEPLGGAWSGATKVSIGISTLAITIVVVTQFLPVLQAELGNAALPNAVYQSMMSQLPAGATALQKFQWLAANGHLWRMLTSSLAVWRTVPLAGTGLTRMAWVVGVPVSATIFPIAYHLINWLLYGAPPPWAPGTFAGGTNTPVKGGRRAGFYRDVGTGQRVPIGGASSSQSSAASCSQ